MKDVLLIITLILSILYILYIIIESFYIVYLRGKIKYVINVNGIRGKSTVTRLIDSGLRECGFKVLSKTTGTIPIYINKDNKEIKIKRLGPANIKEQIKILKEAVKENVDCLVLECMAVNPELQYVVEHRILKSDFTVITNVRYDHLDMMGDSLESIAYSLSNTVPKNGKLILGSDTCIDIFNEVANKNNSLVFVSNDYLLDSFDTFKENINISIELAKVMGLDTSLFYEGMKKYIKDPGALKDYKKMDTVFINGFSINDPDSIKEVYKERIINNYNKDEITLLINFRPDRPFRTYQHINLVKELGYKKVIITGSNLEFIRRKFTNSNIESHILNDFNELLKEKIIFGIGNIKGNGEKIIEYFKKEDK